ncbi:MAG: hypothetical protein KKF41_01360 [Actinobacteria bacterium]|nr:hypothetical protein [Actinomycetota bacterium]MBU1943503.1 hypothetical protein [Actinomycetota bacterium]MBU2686213.1 hypothetical protein [Actinomycetota bacterium]
MTGEYGVEDVCVSLPSVVDASGISRVLEMPLDEEERDRFRASAATLKENIRQAGL